MMQSMLLLSIWQKGFMIKLMSSDETSAVRLIVSSRPSPPPQTCAETPPSALDGSAADVEPLCLMLFEFDGVRSDNWCCPTWLCVAYITLQRGGWWMISSPSTHWHVLNIHIYLCVCVIPGCSDLEQKRVYGVSVGLDLNHEACSSLCSYQVYSSFYILKMWHFRSTEDFLLRGCTWTRVFVVCRCVVHVYGCVGVCVTLQRGFSIGAAAAVQAPRPAWEFKRRSGLCWIPVAMVNNWYLNCKIVQDLKIQRIEETELRFISFSICTRQNNTLLKWIKPLMCFMFTLTSDGLTGNSLSRCCNEEKNPLVDPDSRSSCRLLVFTDHMNRTD